MRVAIIVLKFTQSACCIGLAFVAAWVIYKMDSIWPAKQPTPAEIHDWLTKATPQQVEKLVLDSVKGISASHDTIMLLADSTLLFSLLSLLSFSAEVILRMTGTKERSEVLR